MDAMTSEGSGQFDENKSVEKRALEERSQDLDQVEDDEEDFADEKVVHVAKKPRLVTEIEDSVIEVPLEEAQDEGGSSANDVESAPVALENPSEEPIEEATPPILQDSEPQEEEPMEIDEIPQEIPPQNNANDPVEPVIPVEEAQTISKPAFPVDPRSHARMEAANSSSVIENSSAVIDSSSAIEQASSLQSYAPPSATAEIQPSEAFGMGFPLTNQGNGILPTASDPSLNAGTPAVLPLFIDDKVAPAEMEAYDPDDYVIPTIPKPQDDYKIPTLPKPQATASQRTYKLPPCVHQCVVDMLAEINTTRPEIEFDERTILAMNGLTVSNALAVMQGFQQFLLKNAGPVDTHATIADLITSIKSNKGKKKPVDPRDHHQPAPAKEASPLKSVVPGGIADAVWARLLDCQEDPIAEFTLRDIHSALDTLSKLPAFAQLTIASRFVKSALPTIRNKEAHMQHLIRVYIQENPHLAVIPHVSEIIPSYKTDSGLFDHGYAPPQPVHGVLGNPPFRAYPMEKLMRDQKEKFSLDEFGRVKTHKSSSSSKLLPRTAAPSSSSQSSSSHSAPSSTSLVSIFRKSEMYHRLSPTIRDALEGVYAAGRIKEVLNDTVLQRLMKLPEHLAMRAVDNFRGTDISHVDNLNGFFVGIITRILDRERVAAPPPGRGPAGYGREVPYDDFRAQPNYPPQQYPNAPTTPWAHLPVYDQFIRVLAPSIQNEIIRMVQTGILQSIDEIAEKCYEILGQLAEPLALEALNRYSTSNLESVRNRSGFLIGVVKRVRQEYGVM